MVQAGDCVLGNHRMWQWPPGSVKVSLTLVVVHSSKWQGFILGERGSVCASGVPHRSDSRGIQDQASRYKCLKTQFRARIRA